MGETRNKGCCLIQPAICPHFQWIVPAKNSHSAGSLERQADKLVPLVKPPASDDLGRVGRLNPWEASFLVETGLDPSLPGGADIVRMKEWGGWGEGEGSTQMLKEPELQIKSGWDQFFSAYDVSRIVFPKI